MRVKLPAGQDKGRCHRFLMRYSSQRTRHSSQTGRAAAGVCLLHMTGIRRRACNRDSPHRSRIKIRNQGTGIYSHGKIHRSRIRMCIRRMRGRTAGIHSRRIQYHSSTSSHIRMYHSRGRFRRNTRIRGSSGHTLIRIRRHRRMRACRKTMGIAGRPHVLARCGTEM